LKVPRLCGHSGARIVRAESSSRKKNSRGTLPRTPEVSGSRLEGTQNKPKIKTTGTIAGKTS